MRGVPTSLRGDRAKRVVLACTITMAMLVAGMASISVINETAQARGPAYNGPQTQATGPAYFGPAPNPFPYCDSPTYFDPFPENVNPIGRMDVGDSASVTTDGITMNLVITNEGNPDTQYPGFFPEGGDGDGNDQPKGIELAEGDAAAVTLTAPLFYSQWIFTDVDQPNEGFTVTPQWTVPGQAAAFGGDNNFTFAGTTNTAVELDDINGVGSDSESINGRVQVDFLGAVNGITMQRSFPSDGQSGFAVGGGCEAAGAAKTVVDGPTWNGTSYDVTYELRMRNNLPSSDTIQAVLDDAIDAVGASIVTGTPEGIDLEDLQLSDDLSDDAFASIVVTDKSATGNLVLNDNFDGLADTDLIESGSIAAEDEETITISVQYTPDLGRAEWASCPDGHNYLNQTEVTGTAASVAVSDLSDDGVNAAPSNNNGAGGVDDPTPVNFPCPPGSLDIVKTAVKGPDGDCPSFGDGIKGDGPALPLTVGDVVTYCISVRNAGPGPISNVVISDPQGLGAVAVPDMPANATRTRSFDLPVDLDTETRNTATATATDSSGDLGPVQDTAVIEVSPKPQPLLQIRKTVVEGPDGSCPTFDDAIAGIGDALAVDEGDTVTYCIAVRNVGEGDALNVVITDPQAPNGPIAIGTIAAGQDARRSYNLPIAADTDTENVATASYNGPDGPLPPVDDNAQIEIDPLEAELAIVKTVVEGPNGTCPATFADGIPDDGPALPVLFGEVVTFCIHVKNTGQATATGVVVVDDQADADIDFDSLAAGEEKSAAYDVPVTAATPAQNTATVNGVGPAGEDLTPASDTALIRATAQPDPILEIVKTALIGPGALCPTSFDAGVAGPGTAVMVNNGDVVTYCVAVRNVGANEATNVVITDVQAEGPIAIGNIAVNGEEFAQYDVAIIASTPTTNTATASGEGPNGSLPEVSDTAIIERGQPSLEIVKTVLEGPTATCPATFDLGVKGQGPALDVELGDTVTYCIAVRNAGPGIATDVEITDEQAPASPYDVGTLTAGQVRFEQYDLVVTADRGLINTAVVTGMGPDGQLQDQDDAIINRLDTRVADISLIHSVSKADEECITAAKTLNSLVANRQDLPITWCAKVANTGDVPLTNVVLVAPTAVDGDVDVLAGAGKTVLLPGESVYVPFTGAIPEQGVISRASVQGDPSDTEGNVLPGIASPRDDDNATVLEASIDIETTVAVGADADCSEATEMVVVPEGSDITWCFEVTNTGAVDLDVRQVTDPNLDIAVAVPVGDTRLGPNAKIFLQVNDIAEGATVIDADVKGKPLNAAGEIIDQAPEVEDIDPAQIEIPSADLSIVKTNSNNGPVLVGASITYTLVVSNAGPHAAEGVEVVDTLPVGLEYVSLPGNDGWVCALTANETSFTCRRSAALENGESETLTYTVRTNADATLGTDMINVATVDSETPDPDDTDNTDDSPTRTGVPDEVLPTTELPEYPGPFNTPETPEATPPDEVLGLAITGASSNLLALLSSVMLALGGLLTVGSRRNRDEEL